MNKFSALPVYLLNHLLLAGYIGDSLLLTLIREYISPVKLLLVIWVVTFKFGSKGVFIFNQSLVFVVLARSINMK